MEVVMVAMDWEESGSAALTGGDATEVASDLCDGEIDAAVFTICLPACTGLSAD